MSSDAVQVEYLHLTQVHFVTFQIINLNKHVTNNIHILWFTIIACDTYGSACVLYEVLPEKLGIPECYPGTIL